MVCVLCSLAAACVAAQTMRWMEIAGQLTPKQRYFRAPNVAFVRQRGRVNVATCVAERNLCRSYDPRLSQRCDAHVSALIAFDYKCVHPACACHTAQQLTTPKLMCRAYR
jgi:hypothetical protein